MSGLASIQRGPATFQLPAMGVWQNLCEEWGNTLLARKEIRVELATQDPGAPRALLALKHNVTGLAAQEALLVKHRARQVLTALRTREDHLQLVSWRVNADGSVLQTGSSHVQTATMQQLRFVHARNYVVACLTQSGELQLSRWDVSNTGAIYLAGTRTLDLQPLQWIDMIALDADHIVLLLLTATGDWQFALWRLQDEDTFGLLQTETIAEGATSRCELCVLSQPDGTLCLLTLCSETAAGFRLKVWHYEPDETVSLVADHQIQLPAAATLIAAQARGDYLLTIVQTATGQLRCATWQLATAGTAPICQADRLLHDQVTDCTCQRYGDGFVLCYCTMAGEGQVEVWQHQSDGTAVLVTTGRAPAERCRVSCCDEQLDGNAPFLTATIGTQGAVTLTTWR